VSARRVVGREEELGAIVRLFEASEQLPGTIVLAGEAGVGKTTLWLAGSDAGAASGYRVLTARASEAETGLSFAGLTDLLGSADVLSELPPVQQRALRTALLLEDAGVRADDRAVAAGFLGALRLLASDGPLCLAVDDIQWLDAASLAVVRYALARLEHEPVAAVLTVRGVVPSWLRRAVPDGRLHTVEVAGLSVGALQELLRARLDATFPRPTLVRLWEASRGNPFFALELAAALRRKGGTLALGDELPIPSNLEELLHGRVDDLSASALEVARAAGALASPTVALVEAAVGEVGFDAGLAEALRVRILELDGERLRFTHPLLGSAVAARQTPATRRALHGRLADVVPSAEERARHLALATAEPDSTVAAILEEAARAARTRGAPAAAAELAEQSLRLTPASCPVDARRRTLAVADMHDGAGDRARATALLEQARAAAAPGVERAAILVRLAALEADPRAAEARCHEALAEAEGDDALEATVYLTLSQLTGLWGDGVGRGLDYAELAVRAAARSDGLATRCRALAAHGTMLFHAGRGIPHAELREAVSLERSLPEWPLDNGPTSVYAGLLRRSADVDNARPLFEELLTAARTRGDPWGEADALFDLSVVEWRAGNWDTADRHAADSLDIWTQLGALVTPLELPAVAIAAHRGRLDDARAKSERAVARAETDAIRGQWGYEWVLGFIELSLGDASAACEHLRRSHELRTQFVLEPAMRLELGDLVEALIAVGELSEADQILATWQERAVALDRASALAILARGRGLLLAARGDLDGALASFEQALAEHARSTDPFQHARTLLALGRTQRRAKRRGDARTTLDTALAAFERLGAPPWADQTRAELARIGGRTASRGELTEAERRIATLVAEGRTNRQVAAALFLTEHSVETALTRVYRKLGVRSRTELAHLLSANT